MCRRKQEVLKMERDALLARLEQERLAGSVADPTIATPVTDTLSHTDTEVRLLALGIYHTHFIIDHFLSISQSLGDSVATPPPAPPPPPPPTENFVPALKLTSKSIVSLFDGSGIHMHYMPRISHLNVVQV